jgi:excisionase family DNA binding protein
MTEDKLQDVQLFYGRQSAAQLLDVSPQLIDSKIRAGAISAHRLGRRVLISRDELLRFMAEQPKEQQECGAAL